MAPIPVWSGNLRLSLVLVPVRLFPATSSEGTIAFRMIHEPSGKPIKYLKGIETDHNFEEVPEEEIIKGYEAYQGTSRSHQARGNRPLRYSLRLRRARRRQKSGTSQAGSTISESPKGWVELRTALK